MTKHAVSKAKSTDKFGGISSESVLAKTGRTWPEWVKTLDAEGCAAMAHREIAAIVHDRFEVGPWWSQMVTVGYEQAKGLRQVHQKTDGFSASASITVAAPVSVLFKAWSDARRRAKWIGLSGVRVRKATTDKTIRLDLPGGGILVAGFYAKGPAKSQVAIQQDKLPRKSDVAKFKAQWKDALTRLKTILET